MYLGSVRFFKHLILAAILVIYISLLTIIFLLVGANKQMREMLQLPLPNAPEQSAPAQSQAPVLGLPSAADAQPEAAPPSSVPQNVPYYAGLCPELYVVRPEDQRRPAANTLYLTFDDGPSAYTARILDVLKEYGIQATFFLIGKNISGREDLVRRIAAEGHTIGIHSYSHEYKIVYASVEAFLDDFDQAHRLVSELVGFEPILFRFPGGSINAYSLPVYRGIASEMLRRGFLYHDWNIDAGDTSGLATAQTIQDGVVGGYRLHGQGTVLMHERNLTLQALPQILEELEQYGCHFDKLTGVVQPIVFAYPG